eukprot:m.259509 g.259509  ORF g.259509 m.259509 type:complete len:82 (-) comp38182_c0_seq1:1267-1512(-)
MYVRARFDAVCAVTRFSGRCLHLNVKCRQNRCGFIICHRSHVCTQPTPSDRITRTRLHARVCGCLCVYMYIYVYVCMAVSL